MQQNKMVNIFKWSVLSIFMKIPGYLCVLNCSVTSLRLQDYPFL